MEEKKISEIDSNPNQPRKQFDSLYIRQLADSIQKQGLLQPITIRPYKGRFQIVIGECRYRACKLLNKTTIACSIQELSDEDAFIHSLEENIKRCNLSPIDEANAMLKISSKHREIASKLGMSENRVSQKLSILNLPTELHPFFYSFSGFQPLTETHGRILLSFIKFLDYAIKADVKEERECHHCNDRTESLFFKNFTNKDEVSIYWKNYVYPSWDTKTGSYTKEHHKKIKDCILYDFTKYAYIEGWSTGELEDNLNSFKFDVMYAVTKILPPEDQVDKLIASFREKYKERYKDLQLDKSLMCVDTIFTPIPILKYSKDTEAQKLREDVRIISLEEDANAKTYGHYVCYKRCYEWIRKFGIYENAWMHDMGWFWRYAKQIGMWKDEPLEDEYVETF